MNKTLTIILTTFCVNFILLSLEALKFSRALSRFSSSISIHLFQQATNACQGGRRTGTLSATSLARTRRPLLKLG